jgi:energy-coupling factor transporter ATP-binding protein EcfA2
LDWRSATLRIGAGRMLAGRNYGVSPTQDCVIDLDAKPHLLVAGTTGSGKSTILRMVLASLAYSTAPDVLRIVLVDRKNEDLVPFGALPHVDAMAWTAGDARQAIAGVHAEMQRRVERGRGEWPRLVLVIDELAQVDQASLDLLAAILAVGRSKWVHVVAATQHPTVKLIGDKSNYAVRLVGQVVDGATAAIASGRRGTGAELLPGAGAFLYVDGATLERLQAYNLTAQATAALVAAICDKWCGVAPLAPVRTGAELQIVSVAPQIEELAPVRTGAEVMRFPIARRAPTAAEVVEIRRLRGELGSLNQTIRAVYGSKSSDTHRWISEALATEEPIANTPAPIISMRRGA